MGHGCLFVLSEIIGQWILQRINGVRIGLCIAIFAMLLSLVFQLGHWVFPAADWVLLTRNIWAGVSVLGLVFALFAWLHQ